MRERNRLASQTEGLLKLEAEMADTLELIEMAEAEQDSAMVEDAMRALRNHAVDEPDLH